MKPFSITAPEEIAKEYGGDKRKIQQAASQGLIDPTSAVLAGMFIDRIRGAAAAEQAPQATVAEQVMNPQPQMPSAGLAATPQAAQMQQPMAPQMPQPGAPRMPQPAPPQMTQAPQMPPQQPMGMAMGGGLDAIPYYEGRYAPGGLVSFAEGGNPQDQMMAQSRALIEALQRSRDPAERRAIQDRLRQLTSAMSVAPPGLVTEPLGPQAGDDRAGLANLDMLRQMEADATARANYAAANPVDFGAGMETFAEGVVPRGFTDSDPSALNTGMETFADTQRPVNPYGPEGRIDPNRFNTGTLTEEEAMRIASERRAPQQYAGLIDEFGIGEDGASPASPSVSNLNTKRDTTGKYGFGTLFDAISKAVRDPSIAGTGEDVYGMTDPEGSIAVKGTERDTAVRDLQTDRRGLAAVQTALQTTPQEGASSLVGGRGRVVEQPGERAAAMQAVFGDRVATTQAAPSVQDTGSVTDQIATEQAATKSTTEPTTATEPKTGAKESEKSIEDYFNELSALRGEEVGPATKELQESFAKRADTMSAARKDAFNMALLQTGLGMLSQEGQPGGALQALGKAALPAVKEATAAIREAKKEDRELLKIGAGLEEAKGKRRDDMIAAAVKRYGADKTAAATLQAAETNANRATDFDKNINIRVEGLKNADRIKGDKLKPDSYYTDLALKAYDAQEIQKAQAGALVRAEGQGIAQGLDIAEAKEKVIQQVNEDFGGFTNLQRLEKEAKAKGTTVEALKAAELKRRLAPFDVVAPGGASGNITFSSPEAEAAYKKAMGIQ